MTLVQAEGTARELSAQAAAAAAQAAALAKELSAARAVGEQKSQTGLTTEAEVERRQKLASHGQEGGPSDDEIAHLVELASQASDRSRDGLVQHFFVGHGPGLECIQEHLDWAGGPLDLQQPQLAETCMDVESPLAVSSRRVGDGASPASNGGVIFQNALLK